MIIDLAVIMVLIWAVFKGLRKGLVLAIFSFLAFIVGLAAALKLSATVASWLNESTNISARWLPVLAFLIVFIAVAFLIRIAAKAIESVMRTAMLGWINRLGGVLFFALLYLFIVSILIFYAEKLHLIKQDTVKASVTYPYLAPMGPKIISALGYILPFFKNMFSGLESFFERLSTKHAR